MIFKLYLVNIITKIKQPQSLNMVFRYDKELDIVYIRFSEKKIEESNEDKPGIILDYDIEGSIVGIEVLNASSQMVQPNGIVYEVA